MSHEDEPLTVAPGKPVTRAWTCPIPGPSRSSRRAARPGAGGLAGRG